MVPIVSVAVHPLVHMITGVDSKDKLYIRFAHCVDSEDNLYTFCRLRLRVLFTFHIYLKTISYLVAAGQITWARKWHNLLFVNFTFLCHFFLNRKPLKQAKAERPQVNKAFALLMINSQHIV